jgi:hypothetical protein
MKIISLLFFPGFLAKKLFTKIVHTPIYDSINLCNAHHVVLLKKTPFEDNQLEYKDLYVVDFSPSEDITNWNVVWNIFSGKKIQGKIRVFHLDKCDLSTNVVETILDCQDKLIPLDHIKDIDLDMYRRIQGWDPSFQLYRKNCQHFARYIANDDILSI